MGERGLCHKQKRLMLSVPGENTSQNVLCLEVVYRQCLNLDLFPGNSTRFLSKPSSVEGVGFER